MLDVTEGGGAEGEDRGADGGIGDDLDAEDVGEAGTAVLAVGTEDEVLAFLVEDEEAGEHCAGRGQGVDERGEKLQRAAGVFLILSLGAL